MAKARTVKLLETLDELKQSRTQVALFEDAVQMEKISVPERIRGLSIWVVDENDGVRNLLVSTLQKAGVKNCVGIRSAVDVLWRAQSKQEVQLILSEWKMDPVDGLALFNRLREQGDPAARAKFVLLTGREQRPLVEFALKSGVDGYIIKPFRLQALLDQIDLLVHKDILRQKEQQSRLAALTCLLVNHHSASCDQMRHLLSSAGMKDVVTSSSGAAGLRLLGERPIDVLVYDLNVKQPDWRELQIELRRMPHPPALLLTSVLPTQDELDQMRREGISDFLPGPIRQAELVDAVAKVAGYPAKKPPLPQSSH